MNWYIDVLKKYAVFEGRARRTEFWMFMLISFVVSAILSFLDTSLGMPGVLSGLYSLAVLLPAIGVGVRRMHDTNRSGWWVLLWLLPCIGWIIILILAAQEGTPGENKFGPNPKGA